MHDTLLYFGYNAALTFAGLLFLLTSQNFQADSAPSMKTRGILVAAGLSLLLTPLVAWGISAVVRMRKIAASMATPSA
jgi:hypothetical protein